MAKLLVGRPPIESGTRPALRVANKVEAALAVVVVIATNTVGAVVAVGTAEKGGACGWLLQWTIHDHDQKPP